jgi:hypothetical protein
VTDTLPPDEIRRIAGGRKRARAQLEELKAQGFYRARLGIDGKVVLERPHYDAVCAGREVAPDASQRDTSRPRLRSVANRAT